MLRAAVFASGRGSNFRALDDHIRRRAEASSTRRNGEGAPLWKVALLVTDRPDAGALTIAGERGIPSAVIQPGSDPATSEDQLLALLEEARIDFILLAGYLRLIPAGVVRRFPGRILNIHPALLPSFGGKGMYGARVHRAVLEAGASESGATVHFVDEEYDRGRILARGSIPILPGDTPESLAARVHLVEHRLYPETVNTLARALEKGGDPLALPTILRRFHPVISAVEPS